MLSKVTAFLKTGIWRIRLKNYSRVKSFFLRLLRVILLAGRGFDEDKCKFRASALTFYSLLSIVPVLAMMFGVAKGFGLQEKVEAELTARLQGYGDITEKNEIAENIIEFANSLIEKTSSGFIAGIGVIILFWTIVKVLSSIENSFNDIWGVKKSRSLGRKFSDYLSMILICPFLLVIASSLTVLISSQIEAVLQKIALMEAVAPLIMFAMRLLPYCTIWILLTFIFIFMPNTKVSFGSALWAGIVAGTLFQITQWGYINFQIGAAKYSAIYGSFAALPLFLLWVQISWVVILFGAELSFAHQNVETYEFEQDCLTASSSIKKKLSLLVTQLLVRNFCNGQPATSDTEISHILEIPIRLVRQILFELTGSGILCEARKDNGKDAAYQPAIDADKLTIKYVLEALDQRGHSDIPVGESPELDKLSERLAEISKDIEKSPANILLKDI